MGKWAKPHPRKKTTIQTCLQCGLAFEVPQWKVNQGKGKYCSKDCANEAKKTGQSELLEMICQDCGSPFLRLAYVQKRIDRKAGGVGPRRCRSCASRESARGQDTSGKNNPNHRHGGCDTPEYETWIRIKERCYNPNTPSYSYYGSKGIRMCERWLESFEDFLADMGPRPDGHVISRLDHTRDYAPDNCIWEPWSENSKDTMNRRWGNPSRP